MADKDLETKLGLLVDRKRHNAVGVGNAKLSKERERVLRYYNGELPAPQHKGNSTYVSTDLYDAVESMKAQLLETFANGDEILKFNAQGPEDVEPSRIATEYASYVIFRQNPGYQIMHDAIDDGLKSRTGIVRVYWSDEKEYETEDFDDHPEETVQALGAHEDVHEMDANLNPDGMTYSGSLKRIVENNSQVKIENIAPEDFGIESGAKCLEGSYHHFRALKTFGELKAEGFDVGKLKDVSPDAFVLTDETTEKQYRFDPVDTGSIGEDEDEEDETKRYVVYESYVYYTPDRNEQLKLYKVIRVGNVTLDYEEVERSPFKVFTPLRTAHSFFGNNFAARVIPTQNARTVLTRGILDHTAITNNPRYTVLQGGLVNPREMLDNRFGGLVNTTRPDAVTPLMQASLNPFVYQTLDLLKANGEETTGISSLSQGLNKDAISSQNSQGMVNDLVNLSQTRQKIMARAFAHFLIEVFIEVYTLVLENEDRKSIIEVAGNWVEIDPASWIARKDATVTVHLGQGEADMEAMKFTGLLSMAAQDPELARMIGDQGKYNAAVHIMKLKKIKDTASFIQDPKTLPPPPPNPMLQLQMQELQLKNKELEMKAQMAEWKAQEVAAKAQAEIARAQAEASKAQLDAQLALADSHRKDMDIANKIDVAQRELAIAEKTPAGPDAEKVIVSPN